MNLLVTNDDGIRAPGLRALAAALSDLGEVYVIAPDRERSAIGHAITLHKPLRVWEAHVPGVKAAFATNGTPSDCVVLGALDLIQPPPVLVAAGVNLGPNLGDDITYSGTVAAAMEGVIIGIPALAISVATFESPDYEFAAGFALRLARRIAEEGLPPDSFLNVNVPGLPRDQIQGAVLTRLGRRRYAGRLIRREDPRGRHYYWLMGEPDMDGSQEGTDVAAILQGKISITPAHMDLTRHQALGELGHLVQGL